MEISTRIFFATIPLGLVGTLLVEAGQKEIGLALALTFSAAAIILMVVWARQILNGGVTEIHEIRRRRRSFKSWTE